MNKDKKTTTKKTTSNSYIKKLENRRMQARLRLELRNERKKFLISSFKPLDEKFKKFPLKDDSNIIEINNLTKYVFNSDARTLILDIEHVHVKKGEFVIVFGTSGSGKTTLLNMMSTIDDLSSGTINFKGMLPLHCMNQEEKTTFRRDYISFIFQDFNLIDNLSLLENIKLGCVRKEDYARVDGLVKKLGLEHIKNNLPYKASGGQKQRTAIARSLVKQPAIIFADEPTGALDTVTSKQVMDLLLQLNKEEKITLVMITHNPEIAKQGDRIIKVENGKIIS